MGILLKHTEHNHVIELELGTTPLYKPIYKLTETEYEILKNYLNKTQEKNWIKLSKNLTETFILFILKKNNKLQLYINY